MHHAGTAIMCLQRQEMGYWRFIVLVNVRVISNIIVKESLISACIDDNEQNIDLDGYWDMWQGLVMRICSLPTGAWLLESGHQKDELVVVFPSSYPVCFCQAQLYFNFPLSYVKYITFSHNLYCVSPFSRIEPYCDKSMDPREALNRLEPTEASFLLDLSCIDKSARAVYQMQSESR